MSYNITRTDQFARHLKQLAKKYISIKKDYDELLISLKQNPLQGISLGKNCYKIRWKISSKKGGKSGGARVITYVKIEHQLITLLDVYDKSDRDSITEKELESLIKTQDKHV